MSPQGNLKSLLRNSNAKGAEAQPQRRKSEQNEYYEEVITPKIFEVYYFVVCFSN